MVDIFLESSTHVRPIIGYAISQIFQRGVIIPEIVHFRQVLCTGPVPRKVVDTFLESSTHV